MEPLPHRSTGQRVVEGFTEATASHTECWHSLGDPKGIRRGSQGDPIPKWGILASPNP